MVVEYLVPLGPWDYVIIQFWAVLCSPVCNILLQWGIFLLYLGWWLCDFTGLYLWNLSLAGKLSCCCVSVNGCRMSSVTQGFFVSRDLPKILLALLVTVVLKSLVKVSNFILSLSTTSKGANRPPIIAWNISSTVRALSFSRSNFILTFPSFLSSLDAVWRSSLQVYGHCQYLLLEKFWSSKCSHLTWNIVLPWCNKSGCGTPLLGCAMSIFWTICVSQKCLLSSNHCIWQITGVLGLGICP